MSRARRRIKVEQGVVLQMVVVLVLEGSTQKPHASVRQACKRSSTARQSRRTSSTTSTKQERSSWKSTGRPQPLPSVFFTGLRLTTLHMHTKGTSTARLHTIRSTPRMFGGSADHSPPASRPRRSVALKSTKSSGTKQSALVYQRAELRRGLTPSWRTKCMDRDDNRLLALLEFAPNGIA